jgi:hypothetical protein
MHSNIGIQTKAYLNFNCREGLAVVHTNDGSDHLRQDDHVSKVRLNDVRLLVHGGSLLRFAQLSEKGGVLAGQTASETTTNTVQFFSEW